MQVMDCIMFGKETCDETEDRNKIRFIGFKALELFSLFMT